MSFRLFDGGYFNLSNCCTAHEARRESRRSLPSPRARVPTIVFVFCLHSFTVRDKSLRNSRLRVKAKGPSAFTAFTGFSFTDKSLIYSGLGILVKAMKAKTRLSCSDARVTRAYAREKTNRNRGRFISEINATTSEVEKTISKVSSFHNWFGFATSRAFFCR